LTLDIQLIRDG